MLKKKSVIFIIILILCFVGYQYIYPNYQKSLIDGKVKEQIQSDFISPLQQDLKTCEMDDVTVSLGSLEKNLDFEEYKSYYFSIIVSSNSLEDYEDIADAVNYGYYSKNNDNEKDKDDFEIGL